MNDKIAKLEVKRERLHRYVEMKLEERDYHGVADAAMDLRELEVEVNLFKQTDIDTGVLKVWGRMSESAD